MNTRLLLQNLPEELALHILDFKNHAGAAAMSCTNRFFHTLLKPQMEARLKNRVIIMPEKRSYSEFDDKLVEASGWNKPLTDMLHSDTPGSPTLNLARTKEGCCLLDMYVETTAMEYVNLLEGYNYAAKLNEDGIYHYSLFIPNISFLNALLDKLICLDRGFEYAAAEILASTKLFIKEIPSRFEWVRIGNFRSETASPAFVQYRSGDRKALIKALTVTEESKLPNPISINLTIDSTAHLAITTMFEESNYMNQDGYNPKNRIWVRGFTAAILPFFLAELQKIDPKIKPILEDFQNLTHREEPSQVLSRSGP